MYKVVVYYYVLASPEYCKCKHCFNVLHSGKTAQECDATKDDSSNGVRYQICIKGISRA